ncbi:MAG: prepilin-type N-terminal cleavage/methylation domain-containing protein [Candidatus Nanopelagicales bacterium]
MTLSTLKARKSGLTRRTGAFTLIELIVVIVIIGILAAVAAVSYNSFIAGAENASVESEYSQVAKMIQAESALDQETVVDLAASFDATTAPQGKGNAISGWDFAGDIPAGGAGTINTADDVPVVNAVAGEFVYTNDGITCEGLVFSGTSAGAAPTGDADCAPTAP